MHTTKQLGVFMDHTDAHLIEFTKDSIEIKKETLKFSHDKKDESFGGNEKLLHNKQNHIQSEYYKKIAGIIMNYEDVMLFGPTNAKDELYNILKDDRHFANIKIETRQTDKMTENQQFAFIKEYFQNEVSAERTRLIHP